MLADWWQAAGRKIQCVLSKRGKLVPGLLWITQDPFDGAGRIIDANEKIFPARDNQGVIRAFLARPH